MALPRLVWGETARERELRALVEGLQAERERKDARIAADRKAHAAAIVALREQLAQVIDRLNAARVVRDDLAGRLKAAHAERNTAIADKLRKLADEIEPSTDSQDDRPATDCGADGAGTTPE